MDQDMGAVEEGEGEATAKAVVGHHKTTGLGSEGTSRINTEMRAGKDVSTRREEVDQVDPEDPEDLAELATSAENKTAGMIGFGVVVGIKAETGSNPIVETEAVAPDADVTGTGSETTVKMTGGGMTRTETDGGTAVRGTETERGRGIGIADDNASFNPCTTMYQMHNAQRQLGGRDAGR